MSNEYMKVLKIDACNMDHDIKNVIERELRKNIDKNCDKDEGYISNISDIKIIDNLITRANSEIIFKIKYRADSIFPKKGMLITLKIDSFKEGCIFLKNDKIMGVIPKQKLSEYTYCESTNTFESDIDTLRIGEQLCCKITEVRYRTSGDIKFMCVCEL